MASFLCEQCMVTGQLGCRLPQNHAGAHQVLPRSARRGATASLPAPPVSAMPSAAAAADPAPAAPAPAPAPEPVPAPALSVPPPPPTAAPAAAVGGGGETWTCSWCTLVNTAEKDECASCGKGAPVDTTPLEADVERLAVALSGGELLVGPDDYPPTMSTMNFTHLPNGKCLPQMLFLGVRCLLGDRPKTMSGVKACGNEYHRQLGARGRAILHAYIEGHWRETPHVGVDLPWHDIVTAGHDASHNLLHETWGDDVDEKLRRWRFERDELYCALPEILAFINVLRDAGVDAMVRVWRRSDNQLVKTVSVPELDGAQMPPRMAVLDAQLTGGIDTLQAHYKLLRSGSLHR